MHERLLLAAALFALVQATHTSPAQAADTRATAGSGSFSINANKLPDASKFYKSRIKAQIVDETPDVTDTRRDDDSPVYAISIPPKARGSHPVIFVSPEGAEQGPPGTVLVGPGHLQPSTFGTNIPAHSLIKRDLPSGTTTNRLAGHMDPAQPLLPVASPKALTAAVPAKALTSPELNYDTTSGDSSRKTGTDVKAVLKPRGSLLQH